MPRTGRTVASNRSKVLIVHPLVEQRVPLRQVAVELRAEVLEASSGEDALKLAGDHDCALILLAVEMPNMDGYEVAALLRQEAGTATTPIIFIPDTDLSSHNLRRCYRMGGVDVMLPPIDIEILRRKIKTFVELRDAHRRDQEELDRLQIEHREVLLQHEQLSQQRERMRRQSTHDPLTDLPNRALFEDRVVAAMKRAERARQRIALLYIDLDGFKSLNDEHGHAAGDELLVLLSRRMVSSLRGTDTVARLGGDEFAILLEGFDSIAAADYMGEKMFKVLTEDTQIENTNSGDPLPFKPRASLGLAVFPDHGVDRDTLLMHADVAMYAAKRDGGGVKVYAPSDTDAADAQAKARATDN